MADAVQGCLCRSRLTSRTSDFRSCAIRGTTGLWIGVGLLVADAAGRWNMRRLGSTSTSTAMWCGEARAVRILSTRWISGLQRRLCHFLFVTVVWWVVGDGAGEQRGVSGWRGCGTVRMKACRSFGLYGSRREWARRKKRGRKKKKRGRTESRTRA